MDPVTIAAGVGGFVWKHKGLIAVALLTVALGIQSARLAHAKADQLDRRSCVAHQPCKPPKWQAEARSDEREIADLSGRFQACTVSNARLTTAVTEQNAAVDALKAEGDARTAAATRAVAEARRSSATAPQRAQAALAARQGPDQCRSADDLIFGSVQ